MITSTLKRIDQEAAEAEFKPFEEDALISIAFDQPESFGEICHLLKPELFQQSHTQFIIAYLLNSWQEHNTIPSRDCFMAEMEDHFTGGSAEYDAIEEIIARPSEFRDYPIVKKRILDWSKRNQIKLLYSSEVVEAFKRGDYQPAIEVVERVHKFTHVAGKSLNFFKDIDQVFVASNALHQPSGFPHLDKVINDGGPSPGETMLFMAPPNVGKSVILCNVAILQALNSLDTLFVTLEMSRWTLARRCAAIVSTTNVSDLSNHSQMVSTRIKKTYQTHKGELEIVEMNPDECSVDHILNKITELQRRNNFRPKSIVIDYLDLMISRNAAQNDADYGRLKHIASQLRGLAKKTDTVVYSATQTNRSGTNTEELIDMNKTSESFGKMHATDYVISLNQTPDQHERGEIVMFVAKNRNGPKHHSIPCTINYQNMITKEK